MTKELSVERGSAPKETGLGQPYETRPLLRPTARRFTSVLHLERTRTIENSTTKASKRSAGLTRLHHEARGVSAAPFVFGAVLAWIGVTLITAPAPYASTGLALTGVALLIGGALLVIAGLVNVGA